MLDLPHLTIESVAGCVPANAADNLSILTELVGAEKAQTIVKSTGFATRRVAARGETVLDLALPAARRALEGFAPEAFGGVVAVSFSAGDRFPAMSARLQHALGIPTDVAAVDLSLACCGYPYGLMVAGQIACATGRRVLLVDGDVQSAHVDASDVNTLAVMGDAATATVVAPEGGCARFAFLTDGSGADVLRCGADGRISMDGFGVFRFVAGPVAKLLADFAAACGGRPAAFAPHQANMYMVRQLAKSLSLEDVLLTSGEMYANPGSCSVPLTLAAAGASAAGRAMLAGFGAGLAAAAAMATLAEGCARGVCEV